MKPKIVDIDELTPREREVAAHAMHVLLVVALDRLGNHLEATEEDYNRITSRSFTDRGALQISRDHGVYSATLLVGPIPEHDS